MHLNHPFALDISDLEDLSLELVQQLTDEETSQIEGGTSLTTLAVGEEGGNGGIVCISAPCPGSETGGEPVPSPKPPQPPVTKLSWESGGGPYTKALYESGGSILC